MSIELGLGLGALVLLLVLGYLVVRRSGISSDDYSGPVGTLIAPCVLSIFLVVVAMGIVIGWENKNSADQSAVGEAAAATALYWSTGTFPEEEARQVRDDLRAYVTAVIDEDWPAMSEGELSDGGQERLDDLMGSVNTVASGGRSETVDWLTARQQVAALLDHRVQRADAAEDSIPMALLVAAVVSAVAVAVMPFVSGDRGSRARALLAVVNLAFVVTSVSVLFFIGNAYAGVHPIEPEPLEETLDGFDRIDQIFDVP